MSEQFVRDRRIDLKSLYRLKESIEAVRFHLLEDWFEPRVANNGPVDDKIADLINKLKVCRLEDEKLEKEQLDLLVKLLEGTNPQRPRARNFCRKVEEIARRRKEKASDIPIGWQQTFDALITEIERELDGLKVIRLTWDAISYEDLVNVEQLFDERVFELLPFEACQDFREAGRCFLFEQYKAAVMLSFRAAERVTKEYYHRITGNKEEKQTFESMLKVLEKWGTQPVDQTILDWIRKTKDDRNDFMHSTSRNEELHPFTMKNYVYRASGLCSVLIEDLRNRKKLLAVAIGEPVNLDQALALWMLEKKGGGIGRKIPFDESTEKTAELREALLDCQYKIGGNEGDFKWQADEFPDCIAYRISQRLNLGAQKELFAPLIDFAGRLCQRTPWFSVAESLEPSETLEEIDESLRERFRKSSEKYLSHASRLFDVIWSGNLRPCDPHLAKSLPNEFDTLVTQVKQRLERRAEKRDETEYDGKKCLLIETNAPKPDDEYKRLGFPYVIIRDAVSSSIRVNFFGSGKSNLKALYLEANGRRYNFQYAENQLVSKEPLPDLTLEKIKEIVEAAEIARIGLL